MIGYVLNFTIPRSGEIARPGFLAKKENLPFDKVLGTVVAERIIDVVMLLAIMGITGLMVGSEIIDDITKKFRVEVVIGENFNSSNIEQVILEDSTIGYKALFDLNDEIKKGYIITHVDGKPVDDLMNYFKVNNGKKVKIKGNP